MQSVEAHHARAAEHFDSAAQHHRAAEAASLAGDHETASYQAQLAQGHAVQAHDHSDLAAMALVERHGVLKKAAEKLHAH